MQHVIVGSAGVPTACRRDGRISAIRFARAPDRRIARVVPTPFREGRDSHFLRRRAVSPVYPLPSDARSPPVDAGGEPDPGDDRDWDPGRGSIPDPAI